MIALCIALSLRYVAKLYFCNERIIEFFYVFILMEHIYIDDLINNISIFALKSIYSSAYLCVTALYKYIGFLKVN